MAGPCSSSAKPQEIEVELPLDVALTDDPAQWMPYIDAALSEAKSDHRCLVVPFHVDPELLPPSENFMKVVPGMAIDAIRAAVAEYRQAAVAATPPSKPTEPDVQVLREDKRPSETPDDSRT